LRMASPSYCIGRGSIPAGLSTISGYRYVRIELTNGARMKLSARNQLKGKIVAVQKGQTTAHVRIDIGDGVVVTASITNEAVDDLALTVGDEAIAVIKASDVMVAK
jgi:molybdopterin-binding protein